MAEEDPQAENAAKTPEADDLGGLDPGELLARGLHTVKPSAGAGAWEPPEPEVLGRLLPGYRIESLLGRGGMGAVYKGVQLNLDRPVAIKLLPAEIATDAEFVSRFKREARTLARLQHSRIVTIHDFGQTTEGHLYFVMEYIDGTDLRRILKGPGLDPEQALAVVGQLCDALQAAHREGIVHRDIKPENVLVTKDGYVKLADFGLSRPPQEEGAPNLTDTNMVMGTANYMAPEQQDGAVKADHRSDIFALGVMFYEMLTGQTPRGVFDPPSRKLQIDVRIDQVVLKALQSEPERRYQQVSEMKTDVDRIRSTPLPAKAPGGQTPASAPAKSSRSASTRRRKRDYTPLIGAVVIALFLGVTGYLLWQKDVRSNSHSPAIAVTDATPGARDAGQIQASEDAPFENTLGMKFVPVLIVGGPADGRSMLFSIWQTRVQDFEVFAQETGHRAGNTIFPQGPTHPVASVSWEDAQAFCAWLTERERRAGRIRKNELYRLPTDHEWSCAVGIGGLEDPAQTPEEKDKQNPDIYPWGNTWPPPAGAGNFGGREVESFVAGDSRIRKSAFTEYRDDFPRTSPVGSFAPNKLGIYDLGGNVREWVEDLIAPGRTDRVLRGGAWLYSDRSLRSSYRCGAPPAGRSDVFGFRCVLAPTPAAVADATSGGVVSSSGGGTPTVAPERQAAADRVWKMSVGLPAASPRPTVAPAQNSPPAIGKEDNALTPAEIAEHWLLLFNGKDLTGWSGPAERWSVADGAITTSNSIEHHARTDQPLIWQGGQVADFELAYKARTRPSEGAKWASGWFLFRGILTAAGNNVQARFEQDNAKDTDAGGMAWFPRGKKLRLVDSGDPKKPTIQEIESLGDLKAVRDAYKTDDWNDYKVIAIGNHIRSFANGNQVCDIVDETSDAPKIGHLALTVYFETLGTVQYKDIKLRVLNGAAPAVVPPVSTPASVNPVLVPAGSSPAPTLAADMDALEKALLSHGWTWKPVGTGVFPWTEVVFWRDGTMTTGTQANARWTISGPRSVTLQFNNGDHLTLTFHFGFDYFVGARADGRDAVNGWAKQGSEAAPASNNAPTPGPANAPPPSPADVIQPKSVWRDGEGRTLTILERQGDAYRGRFEVAGIVREFTGTVKGNSISWLAKDVHAIRGNPGGDNFGTINGFGITFAWHDASGRSGAYTLVRVPDQGGQTLPTPPATAPAASLPGGPELSLFNGRDLTGWAGLMTIWSVEDGAITGRLTATNNPGVNTFLVWQGGNVTDFEFTCRYKLVAQNPEGAANSGVQFRAVLTNAARFELRGYQGEMDPGANHPARWTAMPNINGCLTDDPPGILLAATGQKVTVHSGQATNGMGNFDVLDSLGTSEPAAASFRKNDWNDYRIVAVGNRIQIFVNGLQTVDATDEGRRYMSGLLGLQIHCYNRGPKTVQFKDLKLRVLNGAR